MSIWSAVVSCPASTAEESARFYSSRRLQQQTVYNGKAADSLQPPPSSVYSVCSVYRDSVHRLQQQTAYSIYSLLTIKTNERTVNGHMVRSGQLPSVYSRRECTILQQQTSTAADSVQRQRLHRLPRVYSVHFQEQRKGASRNRL
jgi:hypothetical protein